MKPCHKKNNDTLKNRLKVFFTVIGLSFGCAICYSQSNQVNAINPNQKLTAVGTSKNWGSIDGISMIGLVEGPTDVASSLQVVCIFEYTDSDIFKAPPALPAKFNGLVHLNDALNGELTVMRKGGIFAGHAFETLLIDKLPAGIKAKKLLIIGLGDRNNFTPGLMVSIGEIAAREAIKLHIADFSFASDLKDAGIDSPTAEVAANIVKGIAKGYRTEEYLKTKKLTVFSPLTKVYLLAGPAFFYTAGAGIKDAIATLSK